jgi:hypothetical protein
MLGHGSNFDRPNKAQEHLRPRASKTRSQIQDRRILNQGLEFETSESEASETSEFEASETSEFEVLASETLESRDQGFEFI